MVRPGLVVALVAQVAMIAVITFGGSPAHAFERARPMGLYPAGGGSPLAMLDSRIEITVRGPIGYAGPGSLGGTQSALRR